MKHHILYSLEDFKALVEYESNNAGVFTHLAFDLETDGVEETRAKVWGVGLAWDDEDAFYIPFRSQDGTEIFANNEYVIGTVNSWLKKFKVIGHNVIFDTLVWENNVGFDISPYISDDTILMKHLIDEEPPFGLKEIAVKYLGDWADKAQQKMFDNIKANGGSTTKTNLEMYKCDTDILGEYCCWDVLLTQKLFKLFAKEIKLQELDELYNTEVMPLYREVTIPMKKHGIAIDLNYFNKLRQEITKDIQNLEFSILGDLEPLIENFCNKLLEDKAPIKKTGTFPKVLGHQLGLVVDSLAKKNIEKLECTTKLQNDFKLWLTVDYLSDELKAELNKAQWDMYFRSYPDQSHIFNLRSKHHLKHLFFEVLNEEPLSTTETGAPQADDDFLDSIRDKYPWVAKLQDFNKLEKIKGTYIDGILERQIDGFIYASLLQFGTTSGRYASRNPNLQNLPRPKEEDSGLSPLVLKYTNSIRAGFVAPSGYVFVDADHSALEPRCFAHMSGDKNLQLIFHSGEDMYSSIAKRVFKLDDVSTFKKDPNFLGKKYPEKRQIIKALALAVTYGAEAFRIADLLKVDRDEAQQLIDDYLNAYPGLKRYIQDCHFEANRKGFVKTIFGRIRHLPEAKEIHKRFGYDILNSQWAKKRGLSEQRRLYKNKLNNSTNFKIQGLAAHIVNKGMIEINRAFKKHGIDGWVCLQVHDQIVATARKEQAELAKELVQKAMENVAQLDVPLIAEPKIAYNLRDSH